MKIFLDSYGCSFNRADSEIIVGLLSDQSEYEFVDLPEAEVVVLVTCAVKGATESKMVSRIEDYLAMNKRVVVTGCLPAINPRLLQRFDVSVVDANSLNKLPEVLHSKENRAVFSGRHYNRLALPHVPDKSLTGIVPICEGCLGKCAYCGVKRARGDLMSYPVGDIATRVRTLLQNGKKEIYLTAQDCGCYGHDIKTNIVSLTKEILEIKGDYRLRLGMMNPNHVLKLKQGLCELYQDRRVYKFLHIPVQSGSNVVLKDMNRFYSREDFIDIVEFFRGNLPDITIGTDIIVGFPTESEGDFQGTVDLIKKTRPDITNVSKFYPRPNTVASKMKLLPTQKLKERSVELSTLYREISLENNKRYVGRELLCLVTGTAKHGQTLARAPNFKQVILDTLADGFVKTRITGAGRTHLRGQIIK